MGKIWGWRGHWGFQRKEIGDSWEGEEGGVLGKDIGEEIVEKGGSCASLLSFFWYIVKS